MSLPYEYYRVDMEDLLLDVKNPRFASSTLVENASTLPGQKEVIAHLLKHSDVISLAHNIIRTKYLHGSEMITCYESEDGKYIVAEGNRRVCACKLLLNRDLIPAEYVDHFPIANAETLDNIRSVIINLYPDRQSVQSYLSDRHIAGVKTWSTLEKNNYYMNLFQQYHSIDKIKEHTSDSKAPIKKCIVEYRFFMEVFKVLKENGVNLEIEKIDYLPLADRFMSMLVGNDCEVGLGLKLDENSYTYLCPDHKIELYHKILLLVGTAFLARSASDTPSKIIGSDVSNNTLRKELILKDEKIPGLYKLIKEYKGIQETNSTYTPPVEDEPVETSTPSAADSPSTYVPVIPTKYVPKLHKMEYLKFTVDEAKSFVFDENERDIRLQEIIKELSQLKLVVDPIACVGLYRCLLETCARRVFEKNIPATTFSYNESDLASNLNYINNNVAFKGCSGSEIEKTRKAIKNSFGKDGIIDVLNLYIHYPKMVDTTIIANSWNTVKIFIIRCLSM